MSAYQSNVLSPYRLLVAHTARQYEDWVSKLDNWEAAQVLVVDTVADYAQCAESDREAIDQPQEQLDTDDDVDQATQELLGKDCVFFHEFGEVVEARC